MAVTTSDKLSSAVYGFVDHRTYPEEEDVISAVLPSSTLEDLARLLEQARHEVKTSIRELSKLSAPDVDGWISQAKQLRRDIDDTQFKSGEITTIAREGETVQEKAQDGASKVDLLHTEVAFNNTLVTTLTSISDVQATIHDAEATLSAGDEDGAHDIDTVVNGILSAREQLDTLGDLQNAAFAALIKDQISNLHEKLSGTLSVHWNQNIVFDRKKSSVIINRTVPQKPGIDLGTTIKALADLDLLKPKIIMLWKALDEVLLGPLLASQPDRNPASVESKGGVLYLVAAVSAIPIETLLSNVDISKTYLKDSLPSIAYSLILSIMMPNIIARLRSGPLPAAVPPDLDGLSSFKQTLKHVTTFSHAWRMSGCKGTEELDKWVQNAPRVWLSGRASSSLNSMRHLLKRGLGNPRLVEKVETQIVTRDDGMFAANGHEDDWDKAWGEGDKSEATSSNVHATHQQNGGGHPGRGKEEEDTIAWGWDDSAQEETLKVAKTEAATPAAIASADDVDESEAWGWGDDGGKVDTPTTAKRPPPVQPRTPGTNGSTPQAALQERKVTLRETYYVSAFPESILEIIMFMVEDAESLARTG